MCVAIVTKRKRAATVGSNPSKPAPKRTTVRKNTQEINKNGPDGSQPVSEPQPGHSYGTRVTNDRHPGRTAGLEKHTQSLIEAAASHKRAMQQAKLDAKADEVAAKVFRKSAGAQVVGALIARRQQEEQTHNELLLDVSLFHSVNAIDHHTARSLTQTTCLKLSPHQSWMVWDSSRTMNLTMVIKSSWMWLMMTVAVRTMLNRQRH